MSARKAKSSKTQSKSKAKPKHVEVELTPEQQAILSERYEDFVQARNAATQAATMLNDSCTLLAGRGFKVNRTAEGQVQLQRPS